MKKKKDIKNRIFYIFAFICIIMLVLVFRIGQYQIIDRDNLARKAMRQQTKDNIEDAVRGSIIDKDGNYLAISAMSHTVWLRPSEIKSNGKTDEAVKNNAEIEAEKLSEVLEMDKDEILDLMFSNKSMCKLKKNISDETVDILRELNLKGVEIYENTRRYYPMGAFLSHVIGITSDDNYGLTGLELFYEDTLAGTNGRSIISTDSIKRQIIGSDIEYKAKDGYTIITTIDSNIQRIVEENIDKYREVYEAKKVTAIVMNPKTGEILSMAQTGDYDLNNPRTCQPEDEIEYSKLNESQRAAYWNKMWRNVSISDVYEPGSTFKLITASLALDYGVTDMNEQIECFGYREVEDRIIHCCSWPDNHGVEDLTKAICNSCNCFMMELVDRLGKKNFYNGLRSFCITEKTGVDFPGEAQNVIYDEKEVGPVELATMSFGQGIAVSPISLITAISSIANEGKLMQPHFVKEIKDKNGNVIEKINPVVKNVTVSKETAQDVLSAMEASVLQGGGMMARIPGYRIGGKSGTADKVEDGVYAGEVYASFVGVAPIDDPQYVILVIMDSPNLQAGSLTAAYCERDIMEGIFKLENILPTYTKEELERLEADWVEVPDLTTYSIEDAMAIVTYHGLNYAISNDPGAGYYDLSVADQYPKAGNKVDLGTTVTLYYR